MGGRRGAPGAPPPVGEGGPADDARGCVESAVPAPQSCCCRPQASVMRQSPSVTPLCTCMHGPLVNAPRKPPHAWWRYSTAMPHQHALCPAVRARVRLCSSPTYLPTPCLCAPPRPARSCLLKDLAGKTISGLTNSAKNLNPAGDNNCVVGAPHHGWLAGWLADWLHADEGGGHACMQACRLPAATAITPEFACMHACMHVACDHVCACRCVCVGGGGGQVTCSPKRITASHQPVVGPLLHHHRHLHRQQQCSLLFPVRPHATTRPAPAPPHPNA